MKCGTGQNGLRYAMFRTFPDVLRHRAQVWPWTKRISVTIVISSLHSQNLLRGSAISIVGSMFDSVKGSFVSLF